MFSNWYRLKLCIVSSVKPAQLKNKDPQMIGAPYTMVTCFCLQYHCHSTCLVSLVCFVYSLHNNNIGIMT